MAALVVCAAGSGVAAETAAASSVSKPDEPEPPETLEAGQQAPEPPSDVPDARPDPTLREPGEDGSKAKPPPKYRLNFEAGEVQFEDELTALELKDDVVVQVDRYRLTSEALRVERTPSGIVVDGRGRLAFCPCPDPLVAVGFDSVLVAPPTDLLAESATLRIAGVPVLWLPYLWLRSPNRFGVLPAEVAWRGDDGLRLGSGIHVPIQGEDPARPQAMLDLRGAGYTEGGARASATLMTATTTTHLAWDHLERSMFELDAQGSVSLPDRAGASWRADLLRGSRGLAASSEIEEVALLRDQAAVAVMSRGSGRVLGIEVDANFLRGGSADSVGAVGPKAFWGWGTGALGAGVFGVEALTTSLESSQGTLSAAQQSMVLEVDARPGPLLVEAELRQHAGAWSEARGGQLWAQAQASGSVSLPLVRRYPSGVAHWVEPFLRAGGWVGHEVPLWLGEWKGAKHLDLSAGLKTSFGSLGSRRAASLNAKLGWVGPATDPRPVASGRAVVDDPWFALGAETDWELNTENARAVARMRLGPHAGLHVGGYIEGSSGEPPPVGSWREMSQPWFFISGYTAGAELVVPWADWFATAAGADYDLQSREFVATRGSLVYRHECGCLAAEAWAGQRAGRPGFDAGLTVDLMPL